VTNPATRLTELRRGCTAAQALAFFDQLGPVGVDELAGRWRGSELPTGHPLDGALTASGWYGKQFDGPDDVHPLLFATPDGSVFPVDPRRAPVAVAERLPRSVIASGRRALGVLRPLIQARGFRARLRPIEHRGGVSAAMVYDDLPIIDVFRRVDADTVLGLMDRRGVPPYFFVLRRDRRGGTSASRAGPAPS